MEETVKDIVGIYPAKKEEVAPGFFIYRAFPSSLIKETNPYILLDHFGPEKADPEKPAYVPPHPHSGFSPVSLIFSGHAEHKDSLGNHGKVKAGGAQWMKSGKGVIHSEKMGADEKSGVLHGVQLWVNLPSSEKHSDPEYFNIHPEDVPEITFGDSKFRLYSGEYAGYTGPAKSITPLLLGHISLKANKKITIEIPKDFDSAIYILDGELNLPNNKYARQRELIKYGQEGDFLELNPQKDTSILLLCGMAINEPIATYGPFVMNNMNQIMNSIQAFQNGEFGVLND